MGITTRHPDRSEVRRLVLGVLAPGFTGSTPPTWLLEAVRDGLAGVVLFAGNSPDVVTTRALTDALRAAGPVLVAIDEEGGNVSRLQARDGSSLPGAAALGVVDDPDLTRRTGSALGELLRLAGVDLDLAPVLDVASEPRNPVIGVRSFGADPDLVGRHGAALVAGLHAAGVAACGKHLPGHGATTVDSHVGLPVVDADVATLERRDLPPFHAAVRAGLDAVMTAHVRVPALGPAPASLEPAVTRLARALGGGFDGPVITDALDMGAVADDPGLGEACVRALEAGADLLCLGTTVGRDDRAILETAVSALTDAVVAGRLEPDRLTTSASRHARLRRRSAAEAPASVPATADGEQLRRAVADAEAALAVVGAETARRAVAVRGQVRRSGVPVLLDLRRRLNHAAGRTSPALATELARRRPGTLVVLRGEDVPADPDRPLVVLTREPLADADEGRSLAAVLAARPDTVVIHGGTAPAAPDAEHLVLAHGVGRANAEAALDLVVGP
ncbi:glycoside hydrolase family 3 N-terminal domain-containing protein [Georgenia muralis]